MTCEKRGLDEIAAAGTVKVPESVLAGCGEFCILMEEWITGKHGNESEYREGGLELYPQILKINPEVDLAMTEMFGGYPSAFYEGYREGRPLSKEYPLRRQIYQLYHYLNHLNLFGLTYRGAVISILEHLKL